MADTGPLGDSRAVTQWQGGGEQFSQTLETQKQQEHRQASDLDFSAVSSLPAARPPPQPLLLRTGPAFFVMCTAADGVQSGISGLKDSWGGTLGVQRLAETRGRGGTGIQNS